MQAQGCAPTPRAAVGLGTAVWDEGAHRLCTGSQHTHLPKAGLSPLHNGSRHVGQRSQGQRGQAGPWVLSVSPGPVPGWGWWQEGGGRATLQRGHGVGVALRAANLNSGD